MIGSNLTASLAIFSSNKTLMLYGTSAGAWTLVTHSHESGGFAHTMQSIADGYVFDALGVRQIAATDAFGNFTSAQVTRYIRPFIDSRVTLSVGSCISRSRSQYRLIFSDKYELRITFDNGKILGVMPIQYAHTMTCMGSFEDSDGGEWILAGDVDGYVYRFDKGSSFDGNDIIASMTLAFSFMRSPRLRKRYRKAVYEISGGNYAEMEATYDLGYGDTSIEQGGTSSITTPLGDVYWDSFTWDAFSWDGRTLLPAEQSLTGTAENLSLIVRSTSDYFMPFTVNSAIIHYTDRREMR